MNMYISMTLKLLSVVERDVIAGNSRISYVKFYCSFPLALNMM